MTLLMTDFDNYVIIARLEHEPTNLLIIRIPGSRLLISSLPGPTSRASVDSLGKPRNSTSILKALPGKLYFKRQSPSILLKNWYQRGMKYSGVLGCSPQFRRNGPGGFEYQGEGCMSVC